MVKLGVVPVSQDTAAMREWGDLAHHFGAAEGGLI